jgi:hypothetical protein
VVNKCYVLLVKRDVSSFITRKTLAIITAVKEERNGTAN